MVIHTYNLQYTLHNADTAQAIQNMFYIQDRAGLGIGSAETQNTARADQLAVHATTPAEGDAIREDEKGAVAYEGGQSGAGEQEREEKKKNPTSPDGRGSIVDIEA
ncbi:MAG: hypothetical protein RDV41_08865 [Planctomycetota bacterium]|nr:hypothetical protein [Planctomycetota bacterium]